jgi:hypothetical protein
MDTFLVRTLLVPSTVAILGKWNWWPSKVHEDMGFPGSPTPSAADTDASGVDVGVTSAAGAPRTNELRVVRGAEPVGRGYEAVDKGVEGEGA